MKKILPFIVALSFNTIMALNNSYAGSEGGGGGDAQEARVNEIRSDILNWINKGGARGLNLAIPQNHYEDEMKKILQNKVVTLSFTENKVQIYGKEKTCRGYFENNKAQILCNISRFEKTSPSDQYRLIHHEYAGLALVEKNEGAASDYEISNQLTDFLREEKVLKLAVMEEIIEWKKSCGTIGNLRHRKEYCNQYLWDLQRFSDRNHIVQRKWQGSNGDVSNLVMVIQGEAKIIQNDIGKGKLWAVNLTGKSKVNFHDAEKICANLANQNGYEGYKWVVPTKRELNSIGYISVDLRYFSAGEFIWTKSKVNNSHIIGLHHYTEEEKEKSESIYYKVFREFDAEKKGHVVCVANKQHFWD